MFPYIHSLSDILAVFIVTWFYLTTEEKLQPELPISYHSPLGLLGWLPLEINGTFCKVSFFSKGFCIRLALGNRWDIIKVGINIFGWVEFEHACHFIKYVTHKDAFASHLLRDMKKPKIEDVAKIVENTVCKSKHYWETHSMSSDRQSLLLLSLLQMSRILKILIFQLSYVLYFVNFIHTIKTSNLQFCVVITSSLFWPKNVNYWLCERRGPFSSCIETCMFSYISLLI